MRKNMDKQTGQWRPTTCSVYVVLLDEEALKHAKLRDANPDRVPGMPCVYVGSTGKTREERYADHKRGHKDSWWVRKYGIMLLPEEILPTKVCATRGEGEAEEKRLLRELRSRGWAAWSN